jgi:hypothetical protein
VRITTNEILVSTRTVTMTSRVTRRIVNIPRRGFILMERKAKYDPIDKLRNISTATSSFTESLWSTIMLRYIVKFFIKISSKYNVLSLLPAILDGNNNEMKIPVK